jgi:transcriptional regulator GlxA family with amidase domain
VAAFRRVAAYAPPGAVGLGLGLVSAIFRARPGLTNFEFDICTAQPGRLATDLGIPVVVDHGPELFAESDLILLLPGASFAEPPPRPVVAALRAAHERGATLAAHCLGVFHLAATGLLDDLNVTTHWQYADQLTTRYPRVRVQPEALYLDQGNIVTGAGAAAGIDMCLHLIRRDHGAALANSIARILVAPAAPGGWAAAVHYRPAGGQRRRGPVGRRDRMGTGEPGPSAVARRVRGSRIDEPTLVRPSLQGGHRHHTARLASQPAAQPG